MMYPAAVIRMVEIIRMAKFNPDMEMNGIPAISVKGMMRKY